MTKRSTRLAEAPAAIGHEPNGHGLGLAAWRKQKIVEGVLPSGLQVTLRKVKMMDLIGEGHVPVTLDALVRKATSAGFGVSDTLEFLPLVDAVVRACVVAPPIGDEPDDDHLTLQEIPVEDRLAIFAWTNSEAQQLRPFREQPGRDLESPLSGDDVSPTA